MREWLKCSFFGIATTRDVQALHAIVDAILVRIQSIQDSLVEQHQYIGQVATNITAWSNELSQSMEDGTNTVRNIQ